MQLTLNGETRELPAPQSVATLVESLDLRGRFAVEINGDIVLRSEYRQRWLTAGDKVEIVQAIGGG